VLRDRLTQLWLRSEAQRLTSSGRRPSATVADRARKVDRQLVGAELNQHATSSAWICFGPEGILYHALEPEGDRKTQTGEVRSNSVPAQRANTIEGGLRLMRNISRAGLGLP